MRPFSRVSHYDNDPAKTQELLRGALDFLDADCSREEWLQVGAALKTEFSEAEGHSLFHIFSSRSARYNARTTDQQWRSLKPHHFTAGTLFYLAESYGWQRPAPTPQATTRPKNQAELAAEYEALTQRRRAQAQRKREHEKAARADKRRRRRGASMILSSATERQRPGLVSRYLCQRGLDPKALSLPDALPCYGYQWIDREGAVVTRWDKAIVHPIYDMTGTKTGAHVIVLDQGDRKKHARSYGVLQSGQIRLSPPEHWQPGAGRPILRVSEGIENLLSTMAHLDAETVAQTRFASTINAVELARVIVPADTEVLEIDVDKDESRTGEKAALKAYRHSGIKTILNLPPGPRGQDWNDLLSRRPVPRKGYENEENGEGECEDRAWGERQAWDERQGSAGWYQRAKAILAQKPVELLPNLFVRGEAHDIEALQQLPDFQQFVCKQRSEHQYIDEIIAENPIPASARLISMHAGMGSGKTTYCKRLVDQAERALLTTHRVTLTLNLRERMGVEHYQDLPPGPISMGQHKKLVICIDSIPRIVSHSYDGTLFEGLDLVVIDEATKVYDAIFKREYVKSGKSEQLYEALELQLRSFVAQGGRIVIADADLHEEATTFFQKLAGLDDTQIHRVTLPCLPLHYKVHRVPDHATFLDRLHKAAGSGQRLYIPSTSVRDANAIAAQLMELDPADYDPESCTNNEKQRELFEMLEARGILLLTSRTKGFARAQEAISMPNAVWPHYKHVIASPVMESGVDFSVPGHIDAIYCCARSVPGLGRSNITQLIGRVRHLNHQDLYLWVQKRSDRRSLCPDQIREQLFEELLKTEHATAKRLVAPGLVQIEARHEDHFEAYVHCERSRRRDCRNVRRDIFAYFRSFGCPVLEVPPLHKAKKKEIAAQNLALKQRLDEEEYQRVLEAEAIGIEAARELSNKAFPTIEEQREVDRARIVHEWGHIDLDRCQAWYRGEQKFTRHFATMLLLQEPTRHEQYLDFCASQDRQGLTQGALLEVPHKLRSTQFLMTLWEAITLAWPQLPAPNKKIMKFNKNDGLDLSHQGQFVLKDPRNHAPGLTQTQDEKCLDEHALLSVYEMEFRSGVELSNNQVLLAALEEIYSEQHSTLRRLVGLHGNASSPIMEKLGRIVSLFGLRRERKQRREQGKQRYAYRPCHESVVQVTALAEKHFLRLEERLGSWLAMCDEAERHTTQEGFAQPPTDTEQRKARDARERVGSAINVEQQRRRPGKGFGSSGLENVKGWLDARSHSSSSSRGESVPLPSSMASSPGTLDQRQKMQCMEGMQCMLQGEQGFHHSRLVLRSEQILFSDGVEVGTGKSSHEQCGVHDGSGKITEREEVERRGDLGGRRYCADE